MGPWSIITHTHGLALPWFQIKCTITLHPTANLYGKNTRVLEIDCETLISWHQSPLGSVKSGTNVLKEFASIKKRKKVMSVLVLCKDRWRELFEKCGGDSAVSLSRVVQYIMSVSLSSSNTPPHITAKSSFVSIPSLWMISGREQEGVPAI